MDRYHFELPPDEYIIADHGHVVWVGLYVHAYPRSFPTKLYPPHELEDSEGDHLPMDDQGYDKFKE